MLAAWLVLASLFPFVSSEVEKPGLGTGVSTSLDSNGAGGAVHAQTALDAERAFAADARRLGQWSAFRKWAASDATMFVPQPINAQAWLKDRKDPPKLIDWWPTASFVSCDGGTAVNTGGWKRPDGSIGYFTTVWKRQPSGEWKWVLDSGDVAEQPRARIAAPTVVTATCPGPQWFPTAHTHAGPPGYGAEIWEADGYSADKSLSWHWIRWSGGTMELTVELTRKGEVTNIGLKGGARERVIDEKIAPPK